MKEQGSEREKEKITPPIIRIPKCPYKDNSNVRFPKEAPRGEIYAQGNTRSKETLKLENPQILSFPQDK